MDRQAAPYVRGDLDLTDKIIQMVNSGGGGEGDSSKSGKSSDSKKAPKELPKAPAPAKP